MGKFLNIGILRETKHPAERRVPITPGQAAFLQQKYPSVKLFVQSSQTRIFTDKEYMQHGIEVLENLEHCDWLIGIKEVKTEDLLQGKTYLFFPHVIKKQEHNHELFIELKRKKITLVDYELLTDEKGARIVAFGNWAGIVGAYNGLRAWGIRHNHFVLKPAHLCKSKEDLCETLRFLKKPPLKILVTGEGRVAGGVKEMLHCFGALEVAVLDFLWKDFPVPVFCQIGPQHYTRHKMEDPFDFRHFAMWPGEYKSTFQPFTSATDMLITAHFWDPASPIMINREDMLMPEFRIRLIADISCDIPGPIASTIRPSTIKHPFYDFDPTDGLEKEAFSNERNITVMAVDNLPAELPADSSESFGNTLLKYLFPAILGEERSDLIERATILEKGRISARFNYLEDW